MLKSARDVPALRDRTSGLVVGPADPDWDAGRGYLNFEESTVDSRSFYDEVTHRHLRRIKTQVDPGNIFVSNHPIEPAE